MSDAGAKKKPWAVLAYTVADDKAEGAALGPDEFLVTGIDAAVSFHAPGRLPGLRMQILSAEEVSYKDGAWVPARLWNGDETDRGLQFPQDDLAVVRVKLGKF